MSQIYIPQAERDTIKSIDPVELRSRIDLCLQEAQFSVLRSLDLDYCGQYISSQVRNFEQDLKNYCMAKTDKKRTDLRTDALRSGMRLIQAVEQMQTRIAEEEKEEQLFYVDEHIHPPYQFNENLSVRVNFRWRSSSEESWNIGEINIIYKIDTKLNLNPHFPKRKLSTNQIQRHRQDELYKDWEHLKSLALYSVKEFFQNGGDGFDIPKTYHVKTDPYSRGLNNFSANFWCD